MSSVEPRKTLCLVQLYIVVIILWEDYSSVDFKIEDVVTKLLCYGKNGVTLSSLTEGVQSLNIEPVGVKGGKFLFFRASTASSLVPLLFLRG